MTTFKDLNLTEKTVETLEKKGFVTPTDIQEQSIPIILEGKDLIAQSATGSGKTLAFGLGIVDSLAKKKKTQALVLTPTRELAEQIVTVFKSVSKHKSLTTTAIYGGVAIGPQINALRRTDIIVGTPGRVLDHLTRGTMDLSEIEFFVLDEADRMLDMGFIDDIQKIMKACAKQRQTLFFSATMPVPIVKLANTFMNNPEKIRINNYVDPKKLSQNYYDVAPHLKFSLLVHLLREEDTGLVMVFSNTRRITDAIAKGLNNEKIQAFAIHGGLTQQKRNTIIKKFQTKETFVLVCTDVAARGLDIPGVSHVYNYDIPADNKQYVHRIGRTARAGKSGQVINLICKYDHDSFNKVLRENDLDIQKIQTPRIEKIELPLAPSNNRGGRSRGPRGSFGSRGGSRGSSGSGNRGSRGRSFGSKRDSDDSSGSKRRFGSNSNSSSRPRSFGSKRGNRGSRRPRSDD